MTNNEIVWIANINGETVTYITLTDATLVTTDSIEVIEIYATNLEYIMSIDFLTKEQYKTFMLKAGIKMNAELVHSLLCYLQVDDFTLDELFLICLACNISDRFEITKYSLYNKLLNITDETLSN